jgi:hypothetical protein
MSHTNATDPYAKEASLDDFVKLFTTHRITPNKTDVELFCPSLFKDSSSRKKNQVVETHLVVIDYDNSIERKFPHPTDPTKTVKIKECIPNPVTFDTVETMLRTAGFKSILVTSHNHTPAWPKFRVIIFLAEPVPSHVFEEAFTEALAQCGLTSASFTAGMDTSCNQANRFFYLPSSPPEAVERRAVYLEGNASDPWMYIDPTVLNVKAPAGPGRPKKNQAHIPGTWTREQIDRYYRTILPQLRDHGSEWKCACPIHGGANPKNFCVDKNTGMYVCFSECAGNGMKGGGIYTFHYRLRNAQLARSGQQLSWQQAKFEVHQMVGFPPAPSLQQFQNQILLSAAPMPQVLQQVNALPLQDRQQALTLVEAKHGQLDQAMVAEHVVLQAPPGAPGQSAAPPWEGDSQLGGAGGGGMAMPGGGGLSMNGLAGSSDQRAARIWDQFETVIDTAKYDLDRKGTYKVVEKGVGQNKFIDREALSPQPIWVTRIGIDPKSRQQWAEVKWGSNIGDESAWVKVSDLFAKKWDALPNFPVDASRALKFTEYFNDTVAVFGANGLIPVVTEYGWQIPTDLPGVKSELDRPRLVVYHDTQPDMNVVIGPMLSRRGKLEPWRESFEWHAQQDFEQYKVMWVMMALSACAPLIRWLHVRNPIVLIATESSKGKNTVTEWATSIWCNAKKDAMVGASSTMKGTEDKAINMQDLPLIVDEFQRKQGGVGGLASTAEADAVLYSLANGNRRTTSSKTLQAQGGETRKGVNMVNSEVNFASQLEKGARNRTIILSEDYALPDVAATKRAQRVFEHHYGVVGVELERWYNVPGNLERALLEVEQRDARLGTRGVPFVGDDQRIVAAITQGLKVLQEVMGVALPISKTMDYLIRSIIPTREASIEEKADVCDQAFTAFMERIKNANWGAGGTSPDVAMNNEGMIAFRGQQLMYPNDSKYELVVNSRVQQDVMRQFNLKISIANDWAARGYILSQPGRKNQPGKWSRTNTNNVASFQGDGMYVYCVTERGVALADGRLK